MSLPNALLVDVPHEIQALRELAGFLCFMELVEYIDQHLKDFEAKCIAPYKKEIDALTNEVERQKTKVDELETEVEEHKSFIEHIDKKDVTVYKCRSYRTHRPHNVCGDVAVIIGEPGNDFSLAGSCTCGQDATHTRESRLSRGKRKNEAYSFDTLRCSLLL